MQIDLVDVFGSGPLSGNPLAVVRGAEDLEADAMLKLTRWLGYSETTFILPPTDTAADYRVRIFYPAGELPFAGHPTLGTAHAWLASGGVPKHAGRIMQECGIGLVEVRQDADRLAFRAPDLRRSGPLSQADRAETIRLTGVDEEQVIAAVHADNGPGWKLLHLKSAEQVLAVNPVPRAPMPTDVGLLGAWGAGDEKQFEVRAFFADSTGTIVEDPVTGSLNAAVAQYLFEQGLASGSYLAGQGQRTGADGHVHCWKDADGSIWVAGRVETVAQGASLTF
ncbi:PhzF family phenazine biosynthesis protein [Novosphingobium pentaromativorans]|uniref:PhzF family phenazine biosynthesis protein n=1 Tax=Novosphingobium pentaromativorans US6-1 TaxID=1088721 RepID=G6E964_9SPHN|nr:PhzF family phenazine biosynthesis protein [Novosphingobium pentaromativorans]AIT81118.1 phenazine biosynthesis protein PhzF [Novosphingobium pentaromativorans US6-1]EHJ62288.1 PhzF family phenazine biosynthesis protein [Novosphingobium pentaromativorans US6-1]